MAGCALLQVWDAQSGSLLRTMAAREGYINDIVAIEPGDGSRWLLSADDKSVKVWNADSGERLRVFKSHSHWIYPLLAIETDSRHLLLSGDYRGQVRLWDLGARAEHLRGAHKTG
jgi:WD40 repeat protein